MTNPRPIESQCHAPENWKPNCSGDTYVIDFSGGTLIDSPSHQPKPDQEIFWVDEKSRLISGTYVADAIEPNDDNPSSYGGAGRTLVRIPGSDQIYVILEARIFVRASDKDIQDRSSWRLDDRRPILRRK